MGIDSQMDAMGIDIQMEGTVGEKISIAEYNKRKNEYIIFHNNLLLLKYCQYLIFVTQKLKSK